MSAPNPKSPSEEDPEKKRFHKLINLLAIEASQIIVHARMGGEPVRTESSAPAGGFFNINIPKVPEVIAQVRNLLSQEKIEPGKPFCIEISVETSQNEKMILEYWHLELSSEKCDPVLSYTESHSRMGMLLKSVLTLTRMLPAYKFSKEQVQKSLKIRHDVYIGEPRIHQLGEGYKQRTVSQLGTPIGTVQFKVSHRAKIIIPPKKPEEQIIPVIKIENEKNAPNQNSKNEFFKESKTQSGTHLVFRTSPLEGKQKQNTQSEKINVTSKVETLKSETNNIPKETTKSARSENDGTKSEVESMEELMFRMSPLNLQDDKSVMEDSFVDVEKELLEDSFCMVEKEDIETETAQEPDKSDYMEDKENRLCMQTIKDRSISETYVHVNVLNQITLDNIPAKDYHIRPSSCDPDKDFFPPLGSPPERASTKLHYYMNRPITNKDRREILDKCDLELSPNRNHIKYEVPAAEFAKVKRISTGAEYTIVNNDPLLHIDEYQRCQSYDELKARILQRMKQMDSTLKPLE